MSNKLDLFADKEYQEMDWLGKVVEPFIFPLNEKLGKFPDKYDFSYRVIESRIKAGGYINYQELVQICVADLGIDISPDEIESLHSLFEVNIVDFKVNIKTQTTSGEMSLVRLKPSLEDEDIKEHMSNRLYTKLNVLTTDGTHRLNELMDIIGAVDCRTSKSPYMKKNAIQAHMRKIIIEDMWRLRSAPLIEKLGDWMIDYINNGNLASLSNVTRLKCMTYNKDPIYSLKETV